MGAWTHARKCQAWWGWGGSCGTVSLYKDVRPACLLTDLLTYSLTHQRICCRRRWLRASSGSSRGAAPTSSRGRSATLWNAALLIC
eukprot:scaffold45229_cov59-Phaeocystis_antarctica.AAC.3